MSSLALCIIVFIMLYIYISICLARGNCSSPNYFNHTSLAPVQEPASADLSLEPPLKRPRPTLRPHTAPHVVKARESASSRAAPKPKDLGKLLLEQFSTGATSAVKEP